MVVALGIQVSIHKPLQQTLCFLDDVANRMFMNLPAIKPLQFKLSFIADVSVDKRLAQLCL